MPNKLAGKKIAILATEGFEQSELFKPQSALEDEGAETFVISPQSGEIKGWDHTDWGKQAEVDVELSQAKAEDYDALLLPGGVMNPDNLRVIPEAVDFVKKFLDAGKPIGAICHGPWTLIEAGGVKGRILTSWPSLQTDIRNAGGTWVDQEVVTDRGLVTSRKPDDIPAFSRKLIEEIAEGVHSAARKIA
jgi:protease I